MSDNLIESVAPRLAPPVSRERIRSASTSGEGADLQVFGVTLTIGPVPLSFADDAE